MNAAERVEEILVRFGRALSFDQAILIAAAEAGGTPLDPYRRDDAAVLLRAEALLDDGATVRNAIDQARADAEAAGMTANRPQSSNNGAGPTATPAGVGALRRNRDGETPGRSETLRFPQPDTGPGEGEVLAARERPASGLRCHFCQRERVDLAQSPTDPAMWWCPPGDVDCNFHARLRLGIPRRIALAARARELEELGRSRIELPAP